MAHSINEKQDHQGYPFQAISYINNHQIALFLFYCIHGIQDCLIQLMMQSQQFKIEAWQFHQSFAPLSHRHQLKPLQDIITKSKAIHRNLQIHQTTTNNENKEEASYKSVKVNHKKCRTHEIYRNESLSQLNQLVKKQQKECSIIEQNKKLKAKIKNFLSILQPQQEQLSLATKNKQEPMYALRHIKHVTSSRSPKEQSKLKIDQQKQEDKLQNSQRERKYVKKRRSHTNISSEVCLVMLPHFKQRSRNKLRSFFMQTISAIQDLKSLESLNSKKNDIKMEKNKNSPDNARLKKMIEKSNRRKKELEELFKTRPLFGKKQIQRRVGESNLSKILGQQTKKAYAQRMGKNEFDDDSLYCPWSYRQQRLVHHLKRKGFK